MITEQELERALTLKDEIRDIKILISKLESSKISRSNTMNSKISIDANTINVNDYTIATLKRFHNEIVNDYRHELFQLEEEYKSIICSTEEAFERALIDADSGYTYDDEKEG